MKKDIYYAELGPLWVSMAPRHWGFSAHFCRFCCWAWVHIGPFEFGWSR